MMKVPNLVSFNGDGDREEDAARQADVRSAVKDGVENVENSLREAQGQRNEEEAAGEECDVSQAEAGQQGGENSLGLPGEYSWPL